MTHHLLSFVLAVALMIPSARAEDTTNAAAICDLIAIPPVDVQPDKETVGFLKTVDGEVRLLRRSLDGSVQQLVGQVGMGILGSDAIATGANGAFSAVLVDNSKISGVSETCVKIARYVNDRSTEGREHSVRVGRGAISITAGSIDRVEGDTMSVRVRTDTLLAVTGTRLVIRAE